MAHELPPPASELLAEYPDIGLTSVRVASNAVDFAKHVKRQQRRGMIGGSIGIIWLPNNMLPLVRRTKTLAGWALPSGGVEPGYSYHDTLIKEMNEEVGVDLDPSSIRLIVAERKVFVSPDGGELEMIMATFDADAAPGAIAHQTPEATAEGLTLATFPYMHLPDLIHTDAEKIALSASLRQHDLAA